MENKREFYQAKVYEKTLKNTRENRLRMRKLPTAAARCRIPAMAAKNGKQLN